MGRLIDGEWRTDITNDDTEDVDLEPTAFRAEIGPDGPHPPVPERYHLYVSRACPWAHGTLLTRRLLGLDDAVTIDVVDPHRADDGWEFSPDKAGCTPDTINGSDYLREVYTAAEPTYTGRVSVPVLWDQERETIVNEESDEIMRTLADAFADHRGVDLYPEDRREEVDEVIEALYGPLNRGVYAAGFASSQAEYEAAVETVFDALDRWESVLSDQRYLLGDELTLADLRLFPTLVRFDAVYHTHFKCNVRRLVDYPNLWGYTRDIYQMDGVAETVDLGHIKEHYYRSHDDIDPTGFVPAGPEIDFEAPHDRDELPGEPPEPLA
ncbi:glutathione S-transferase C-terminal domain-containing protein [Natrinema sp. 1APR25-10V2]|uniref:glutathione S-transferase family protein n=1 Tax=Natrinema sp. 1APR25-10V2 TaxID=2951081 RepID=UPI00287478A8|nr:glutathione S-transferase C-terminal domain-containing protein [Natrinema sp. 1APR25-10V2]MDS0475230.1 glutathione S-transferase C-terminal domain-containing protein [Natrinema sp. 1APR25-10V2]